MGNESQMKLTDKQKVNILMNITKGPYSREATFDSLDDKMKELLDMDNFTDGKYNLTTHQIQILLNIINILTKEDES